MCHLCRWKEVLDDLEDLLEDSKFEWAHETLSGIFDTVGEKEHVTDGQITAIENITNSVRRGK